MNNAANATNTAGRLFGQVAVVTGAAQGIGAACARVFAREGASVLLADVNEITCMEVVEEIKCAGGIASFLKVDVTQESEIVAMIDAAVSRFGRLNILLNNAGGIPAAADERSTNISGNANKGTTLIDTLTSEGWDATHALNLRAVFLGVKYALPYLRAAKGGSIISIGSTAAMRGLPGGEHYTAFKAGIHAFTETFAQSIGVDNIRINAIAPGWTATPNVLDRMENGAAETLLPIAQPPKRARMPEDIANAALFLASDEASFITGVVLRVDGGWVIQGDQNQEFVLRAAGVDQSN